MEDDDEMLTFFLVIVFMILPFASFFSTVISIINVAACMILQFVIMDGSVKMDNVIYLAALFILMTIEFSRFMMVALGATIIARSMFPSPEHLLKVKHLSVYAFYLVSALYRCSGAPLLPLLLEGVVLALLFEFRFGKHIPIVDPNLLYAICGPFFLCVMQVFSFDRYWMPRLFWLLQVSYFLKKSSLEDKSVDFTLSFYRIHATRVLALFFFAFAVFWPSLSWSQRMHYAAAALLALREGYLTNRNLSQALLFSAFVISILWPRMTGAWSVLGYFGASIVECYLLLLFVGTKYFMYDVLLSKPPLLSTGAVEASFHEPSETQLKELENGSIVYALLRSNDGIFVRAIVVMVAAIDREASLFAATNPHGGGTFPDINGSQIRIPCKNYMKKAN